MDNVLNKLSDFIVFIFYINLANWDSLWALLFVETFEALMKHKSITDSAIIFFSMQTSNKIYSQTSISLWQLQSLSSWKNAACPFCFLARALM